MVFEVMNMYDIVVDSVVPPSTASAEELLGYKTLSKHALLVLIQVISKLILKKVSKYRSPHAIWKYLKETYYRDTAFSFIHQVVSLCLLFTQLEEGMPVAAFMDKFDDQWVRVLELSYGTDLYRQKFKAFLEEDFAKRDFLLAALSRVYPNPVDNLTTKTNLTYTEVRYRMMSLASSNQLEQPEGGNTALITSNNNHRNNNKNKHKSSESTKMCSYCQKHGGTPVSHI